MTYCVRFREVAEALASVSYRDVDRIEGVVIFEHPQGRRLYLHAPNENGDIPEMLVNDAFDAAGLDPPAWNVFWCD